MSRPSAEVQIRFLEYIQRLLDGGGFVATYKFALLMALADLSVEKGDDDDAPLPLHAQDVARKFIGYYARQARPYVAGAGGGILHQNTGGQAAVVTRVLEAAAAYSTAAGAVTAPALERDRDLVSRVTDIVAKMPLWKLQTIGARVEDFLYPNIGAGRDFTLNPGIAFCFRKFHGFVYRLAQDGWLRFVRARIQNAAILGESADLADFMFGANRASLAPYRPVLVELQNRQCFYCGRDRETNHVDHFIPWSWYSLDLGHNFVLACGQCNGAKGDMLAAPRHLENWLRRNDDHGAWIASELDARTLPHDLTATTLVARWAYGRVAGVSGATWVAKRDVEVISGAAGWIFPGAA
jgi:hypothetical protein